MKDKLLHPFIFAIKYNYVLTYDYSYTKYIFYVLQILCFT